MLLDTVPQPGLSAQPAQIDFERSLKGLTGIALKGVFLALPTLGLYRFWYMTNLRKFFWSRTTIDSSPAEYTGTGTELFLGFIVAIAIIAPIYVVIFVISIIFPLPLAAPVLTFVTLFLLGQFASYRGRRYRAVRTLWRGIRLGQDGSAIAYAARATGWSVFTLLTLGLAYPFMRADLERYRIKHTLIGNARLDSVAQGRSIFHNWLILYVVGVLPILVACAAVIAINDYSIPFDLYIPDPSKKGGLMMNPSYKGRPVEFIATIFPLIAFLAIGFAALLFPYYKARELRLFLSSMRLEGAQIVSSLRARSLYKPYLIYFGSFVAWVIILTILVVLFVILKTNGLLNPGVSSIANYFIFGGAIVFYVASVVGLTVLYIRVVQAGLWGAIARHSQITDVSVLERIVASTRGTGSKLDEGIADALDVAGAIQIGF